MPYLVRDAKPGVATKAVVLLRLAAVDVPARQAAFVGIAASGDLAAPAARLAAVFRLSADEVAGGDENRDPPTPTPTQGARPTLGHPDPFPPRCSSPNPTRVGAVTMVGVTGAAGAAAAATAIVVVGKGAAAMAGVSGMSRVVGAAVTAVVCVV